MFVSKEIPTGLVNSVNTVFTLLNTPTQIDDVFVDGAVYVSFTIVGNILTLVDAPTVSIYVDYTYGPVAVPTDSSITFGDIKSKVWSLLGQKPTSTTFSDTIVGDAINAELKRVIKGRITSKLDTNRIYRVGKLTFMQGKQPIRINDPVMITVQYNVGDTTITCETSGLLGAGYAEIGGDTINYTSKSATQLLGVTGGTISHLVDERVIQLYETQSDIDKPSSVEYVINGTTSKTIDIPLDNNQSFGTYYTIVRTGTKQLLKLVGLPGDSLVLNTYQKKVSNMTANTDISILPEDYGETVLAYLVAGQFAFEKGMPNAQSILVSAYTSLQNMYQDFSNEIIITKQKLRPSIGR